MYTDIKLIQEVDLQQHIRSSVDQMAEVLQFSPPTAIYRQVLSPSMKRSTYGLILLYIVLVMFFPSAELVGSLLSTPRQPLVVLISAVFFGTFSIFTLVFTLILLRRATTPWYVLLYPEGLISAQGRRLEIARWEKVRAIRQKHITKTGFPSTIRLLQYTLEMADGKQFPFTNTFLNLETAHLLDPRDRSLPLFKLIGCEETEVLPLYARFEAAWKQEAELLHVLEHEVLTRLLSEAIATYQAGLSVTFGQLQISIRGISDGKTTLPWGEFDSIVLHGEDGDDRLTESVPFADSSTLDKRLAWWQGNVIPRDIMLIAGKGMQRPLWSLVLSEIPNAFLLMELVGYALHQQTPPG